MMSVVRVLLGSVALRLISHVEVSHLLHGSLNCNAIQWISYIYYISRLLFYVSYRK